MGELKTCPFCASSDSFVERADLSACCVVCNDCGARGPASCDVNASDAFESEYGDAEPGEMPARRLWNCRGTLKETPVSLKVASPVSSEVQSAGSDWNAAVEAALYEADFLRLRIGELDWSMGFEDFINNWNGHVDPPLTRLGWALDEVIAIRKLQRVGEE